MRRRNEANKIIYFKGITIANQAASEECWLATQAAIDKYDLRNQFPGVPLMFKASDSQDWDPSLFVIVHVPRGNTTPGPTSVERQSAIPANTVPAVRPKGDDGKSDRSMSPKSDRVEAAPATQVDAGDLKDDDDADYEEAVDDEGKEGQTPADGDKDKPTAKQVGEDPVADQGTECSFAISAATGSFMKVDGEKVTQSELDREEAKEATERLKEVSVDEKMAGPPDSPPEEGEELVFAAIPEQPADRSDLLRQPEAEGKSVSKPDKLDPSPAVGTERVPMPAPARLTKGSGESSRKVTNDDGKKDGPPPDGAKARTRTPSKPPTARPPPPPDTDAGDKAKGQDRPSTDTFRPGGRSTAAESPRFGTREPTPTRAARDPSPRAQTRGRSPRAPAAPRNRGEGKSFAPRRSEPSKEPAAPRDAHNHGKGSAMPNWFSDDGKGGKGSAMPRGAAQSSEGKGTAHSRGPSPTPGKKAPAEPAQSSQGSEPNYGDPNMFSVRHPPITNARPGSIAVGTWFGRGVDGRLRTEIVNGSFTLVAKSLTCHSAESSAPTTHKDPTFYVMSVSRTGCETRKSNLSEKAHFPDVGWPEAFGVIKQGMPLPGNPAFKVRDYQLEGVMPQTAIGNDPKEMVPPACTGYPESRIWPMKVNTGEGRLEYPKSTKYLEFMLLRWRQTSQDVYLHRLMRSAWEAECQAEYSFLSAYVWPYACLMQNAYRAHALTHAIASADSAIAGVAAPWWTETPDGYREILANVNEANGESLSTALWWRSQFMGIHSRPLMRWEVNDNEEPSDENLAFAGIEIFVNSSMDLENLPMPFGKLSRNDRTIMMQAYGAYNTLSNGSRLAHYLDMLRMPHEPENKGGKSSFAVGWVVRTDSMVNQRIFSMAPTPKGDCSFLVCANGTPELEAFHSLLTAPFRTDVVSDRMDEQSRTRPHKGDNLHRNDCQRPYGTILNAEVKYAVPHVRSPLPAGLIPNHIWLRKAIEQMVLPSIPDSDHTGHYGKAVGQRPAFWIPQMLEVESMHNDGHWNKYWASSFVLPYADKKVFPQMIDRLRDAQFPRKNGAPMMRPPFGMIESNDLDEAMEQFSRSATSLRYFDWPSTLLMINNNADRHQVIRTVPWTVVDPSDVSRMHIVFPGSSDSIEAIATRRDRYQRSKVTKPKDMDDLGTEAKEQGEKILYFLKLYEKNMTMLSKEVEADVVSLQRKMDLLCNRREVALSIYETCAKQHLTETARPGYTAEDRVDELALTETMSRIKEAGESGEHHVTGYLLPDRLLRQRAQYSPLKLLDGEAATEVSLNDVVGFLPEDSLGAYSQVSKMRDSIMRANDQKKRANVGFNGRTADWKNPKKIFFDDAPRNSHDDDMDYY